MENEERRGAGRKKRGCRSCERGAGAEAGGGTGPEDQSIFIPACHKRIHISRILSGRCTVSFSRHVKPFSSAPEPDTRPLILGPNLSTIKAVIFDEFLGKNTRFQLDTLAIFLPL